MSPYAAQIQGVYVDPDRRGEGLATIGMAAVVQRSERRSRRSCRSTSTSGTCLRAGHTRRRFQGDRALHHDHVLNWSVHPFGTCPCRSPGGYMQTMPETVAGRHQGLIMERDMRRVVLASLAVLAAGLRGRGWVSRRMRRTTRRRRRPGRSRTTEAARRLQASRRHLRGEPLVRQPLRQRGARSTARHVEGSPTRRSRDDAGRPGRRRPTHASRRTT